MSVLSIQTRRIDGLTEATTAEDEDLLLIRKADGTGTRNIKKKNLVPETGVGNIKELETKDKTSVVKAVNELRESIGDLNGYGNYSFRGKRDLVNFASDAFRCQQQSFANLKNDIDQINLKLTRMTGAGAGFHNSIFGGRQLQDGLTAERVQAIRNGDFGDMFIGDRIDDFVIAHFDYFYGRFSDRSDVFSKHHVVLVPMIADIGQRQFCLDGEQKCYKYSPMRPKVETYYSLLSVLKNAKWYNHYCPMETWMVKNTNTDVYTIQNNAEQGQIECMSAKMVFGFEVECEVKYHRSASSETQFALFRLAPEYISAGNSYWLTNSYDAYYSYVVNTIGNLNFARRNEFYFLRPYVVVG